MSMYVYRITKVYADKKNNPPDIKAGHLIFELSYEGKKITPTYFDRKLKKFLRYYEAEFLFKTDADIWTEEGKKEFEEKLKKFEEEEQKRRERNE